MNKKTLFNLIIALALICTAVASPQFIARADETVPPATEAPATEVVVEDVPATEAPAESPATEAAPAVQSNNGNDGGNCPDGSNPPCNSTEEPTATESATEAPTAVETHAPGDCGPGMQDVDGVCTPNGNGNGGNSNPCPPGQNADSDGKCQPNGGGGGNNCQNQGQGSGGEDQGGGKEGCGETPTVVVTTPPPPTETEETPTEGTPTVVVTTPPPPTETPCSPDYNGEEQGCGEPPVICEDPNAINNGAEGECQYPPEDPCESWVYWSFHPRVCGWFEEKEEKVSSPAACTAIEPILYVDPSDSNVKSLVGPTDVTPTNLTENVEYVITNPDGNETCNYVAVGNRDGKANIVLMNAAGIVLWLTDGNNDSSPTWTTDGNITYADEYGEMHVIDVKGELVADLGAGKDPINANNRDLLAYTNQFGNIVVGSKTFDVKGQPVNFDWKTTTLYFRGADSNIQLLNYNNGQVIASEFSPFDYAPNPEDSNDAVFELNGVLWQQSTQATIVIGIQPDWYLK